jgi:hypothetical protein
MVCFRPPAPIPMIACRNGSRFSGQSDKSLKQLHVHSFAGISAADLPHLVDVIDVIHRLDIGPAYVIQRKLT